MWHPCISSLCFFCWDRLCSLFLEMIRRCCQLDPMRSLKVTIACVELWICGSPSLGGYLLYCLKNWSFPTAESPPFVNHTPWMRMSLPMPMSWNCLVWSSMLCYWGSFMLDSDMCLIVFLCGCYARCQRWLLLSSYPAAVILFSCVCRQGWPSCCQVL